MARITRSRQDPALKTETRTTRAITTANTVIEKEAKGKSSKAKPRSKTLIQGENVVPPTKGKISSAKSSIKKALIEDESTVPPTKGKNSNVKSKTKKTLSQDENAVPAAKGKVSNVKSSIKKALVQDENAVPAAKGKVSNVKSSIKKVLTQDENAVPFVNKIKANVKSSQSKVSVLGSKLHTTRKNNSSVRRSSILALKSPVLRDRTNTTNEHVTSNNSVKKVDDVQLTKNKKVTKTNAIKKSSKKNDKNEKEIQVSIKKYVVSKPVLQNKEIVKENIEKDKVTLSNLIENENIRDQVSSAKSPESNALKSRKRNNLSMEAVEELLNEDDQEPEIENKELNENKLTKENVPKELNDIDVKGNEKESQKITKKFFKHKIDVDNVMINPLNRKNPKRQAVRGKKAATTKKVVKSDPSFSPNIEEQRKSTKPPEKKLRTRAIKNYCEVSKVSQDSKSEKKQANEETPVTENDKKGVPIYKTIQLSQEKDNEEVYEFPDDSQEREQKVKKRKKTTKRPTVKRAKKVASLQPETAVQKTKKKPGSVPKNVQFKEQEEKSVTKSKQDVKNSVYKNIEMPDDLLNAGDSTIAEASTIKIISDKRLERSERINLMVTPSAPKTINSELKLFGPKNAITSQPKIQYSNMVNHSLIRQSMSPITKEVDNFDIGSPWRPIDAFSRVQKVVQSTPQINKVFAGREKKPLTQMNLNKKSISSEDTIHLSSVANEKLTKQNVTNNTTPTQGANVSPRKFGTVISNLNSMETIIMSSGKQASVQDKQQTPAKAVTPPTSFENDLENQDDIPLISSIPATCSKENNTLSPNKSPKKKINTPSPFRFDRLRSSKRIASIGSKSNADNSISQKENKDPNTFAGPLDSEKPNTTALRQSNLNNFLNLDEMPESTRISTAHGIFDDVHSTPINGKKPQKIFVEPNIENAFGFDDDCDFSEEISDIEKPSGPIIATAKDVARSVKGKLFPKARVKSTLTRVPENTVKKTLLQTVLKMSVPEAKASENKEDAEKNDDEKETDKSIKDLENNNKPLDPKKAIVEAVSFSDTFDILSENGEDLSLKVPDEIPLFVDLEPVRFTKPPRRSYNKRKKAVYFNTSRDDSENEEEDIDYDKPKKKRKKESKLSKEEQKRMQEWVKSINNTFEEIDHFDLVVE